MILFISAGQLGNQLFQYAFLKTIKKHKEKFLVYGFDELKEVFEVNDFIHISKKNRILRKIMYSIIRRIMDLLADLRIISSVSVDKEVVFGKYVREDITYKRKKGLIYFFTFVKTGYFQSEAFFDLNAIEHLKIKEKYLSSAEDFMKSIPFNCYKVFVHIRLGDYKNFLVYGKTAIPPFSYFHSQIKWFMRSRENCFFIFLSDEPQFIEREFDYLTNKKVSINKHFGIDFAVMTKCNGAILSPSSFGWWGSYFMGNRDVVIAPKYWTGYASREDFPKGTLAHFMKGVDISVKENV